MKSSVAVFITPSTSSTKSTPAKVFSVDFLKRSSRREFATEFQGKLPAAAAITRIRIKIGTRDASRLPKPYKLVAPDGTVR
jgi:hypothetical protein